MFSANILAKSMVAFLSATGRDGALVFSLTFHRQLFHHSVEDAAKDQSITLLPPLRKVSTDVNKTFGEEVFTIGPSLECLKIILTQC